MRRPFLFLLLAVPATVAAQTPMVGRPQLRCPAYDSLMRGARQSDPGVAAAQLLRGARMIHISLPARIADNDHGITDVSLTVRADTGVGPEGSALQVMAHLNEQEERPLSERQGLLLLDDTLTIDIGSLGQTPGATFPNGAKTWYLYGPAPHGSIVALARAKQIEFKAGSTRWPFPPELVRNVRGGLAALVCR